MTSYALTSVGSILNRLQQRTQAPAGSFWSTAEYLYAINEALRIWQAMSGTLTGAVQINTSNLDGVWLEVPKQLVGVSRVTVNGVALTQEQLSTMDYTKPRWETATPGAMKLWVLDGITRIAVYPRPASDQTLLLEGPMEANNLGPGDFVNVGNEELTTILDYCLHYLSIKEGPSEMDATIDGMKRLVVAAAERNQQLRKRDLFKKYAGQGNDAVGDTYRTKTGQPSVGARG